MAINKAQGQTLHMAGLCLATQPFSHGQCMWPTLGLGLEVLCEWFSVVARSEIEKECM